jgi:hypothetical protein
MVEDLLAPGGGVVALRGRPPVSHLVAESQVVASRPQFAVAANRAGIPFVIDPLTPLLEGHLKPTDPWAMLPFGQVEAVTPDCLGERQFLQRLVATVVEFEVEKGATVIVPPYLYSSSPDDPRLNFTLEAIRLTVAYLDDQDIPLSIAPVLAAQLHRFAPRAAWTDGLDRFRAVATEFDPDFIALCMSPIGDGHDSYNKVFSLFEAATRFRDTSSSVVAWRQGMYGEALTAAGLAGYETGAGTREQANISRLVSSRKPSPKGRKSGGASVGVFLEPLGRSIPKPAAQALLGTLQMRAKLMCDDESCCPDGPFSTLEHPREHAIRTRARKLHDLDVMPERRWRLHRVARSSSLAATVTRQANKVLRAEGSTFSLPEKGMESLSRVVEHLLEVADTAASS